MRKTKEVLDAEQKFNQLKKKADKEPLSTKERLELKESLKVILFFYNKD